MPRADHVTKKDVEKTLEWMFSKINKEVETQQLDAEEKNQHLLSEFQQGKIATQELANSFQQVPGRLASKDFEHVARKFCKNARVTKQATNTSGNYLTFDDERMQECLAALLLQSVFLFARAKSRVKLSKRF